jgi:hypothetical protein
MEHVIILLMFALILSPPVIYVLYKGLRKRPNMTKGTALMASSGIGLAIALAGVAFLVPLAPQHGSAGAKREVTTNVASTVQKPHEDALSQGESEEERECLAKAATYSAHAKREELRVGYDTARANLEVSVRALGHRCGFMIFRDRFCGQESGVDPRCPAIELFLTGSAKRSMSTADVERCAYALGDYLDSTAKLEAAGAPLDIRREWAAAKLQDMEATCVATGSH